MLHKKRECIRLAMALLLAGSSASAQDGLHRYWPRLYTTSELLQTPIGFAP